MKNPPISDKRAAHIFLAAAAAWVFNTLLAIGFHHAVRAAACGGVAFLFLLIGLIFWNFPPPGGPKPPTRGKGGRVLARA